MQAKAIDKNRVHRKAADDRKDIPLRKAKAVRKDILLREFSPKLFLKSIRNLIIPQNYEKNPILTNASPPIPILYIKV